MKFYEYESTEAAMTRATGGNREEAESICLRAFKKMVARGDVNAAAQYVHDKNWVEDRRPYYLIYPSVIPLLTRISLDFPGDCVHFPKDLRTLVLRFPEGHGKIITPYGELRSILAAPVNTKPRPKPGDALGVSYPSNGLAVYFDCGERMPSPYFQGGIPLYDYVIFRLDSQSVDASLHSVPVDEHSRKENVTMDDPWRISAMKLLITVLLIQDDPNLINPDVLGRDDNELLRALGKNDTERIKFLQDRAFRRRGPGWEIGRRYERCPGMPYVVPPHPQRYWTGVGRTKVVVKTRSGYVVEKNRIIKVPTGFQDDSSLPEK